MKTTSPAGPTRSGCYDCVDLHTPVSDEPCRSCGFPVDPKGTPTHWQRAAALKTPAEWCGECGWHDNHPTSKRCKNCRYPTEPGGRPTNWVRPLVPTTLPNPADVDPAMDFSQQLQAEPFPGPNCRCALLGIECTHGDGLAARRRAVIEEIHRGAEMTEPVDQGPVCNVCDRPEAVCKADDQCAAVAWRDLEAYLRAVGIHPDERCTCGGGLRREEGICNATCVQCGARYLVKWPANYDSHGNFLEGAGKGKDDDE